MGEVVSLPARIPYPAEASSFGLDAQMWKVLVESTFPSATTPEGILLAVSYCKARNLDILKRPVSIVPMYSSALRREVETVWPGINELQTTAARTGEFAGVDSPVYGEMQTRTFTGKVRAKEGNRESWKDEEITLQFPEWCEVTVYRLVGGVRCPFTERVEWLETYSRRGWRGDLPTPVWVKRPKMQLAKCAKAASLRAAFPEECGGYSAEEMDGKVIEADEVDIPRRSKDRSRSLRIVDIDPDTGEVANDVPDPMPDLTRVSAAVKAQVAKIIARAVASGAWESAIGYVAERFQQNDLVYARYMLRRAERFQPVSANTRRQTSELVARAADKGAWDMAIEFVNAQAKAGKMNELDREFAISEVELARAEAEALPMQESA